MKLQNLFEESNVLTDEQKEWLVAHTDNYDLRSGEFLIKGGKIDVTANFCYVEEFDQGFDPLPDNIRFGNVRLFYYKNCVLTNFDLMPTTAQSVFFNADTEAPSSLKGLSKVLKSCKKLTINKSVKSGLLEVFKIKGMEGVSYQPGKRETKKNAIEKAIKIVNTHLATGDVFQCQEDLHTAGLGQFQ